MPSAPRLTATDLRFDGPHGPRLGPLSVDWGPGLHAITGDEGCGKTTLLRLLSGRLEPSGGRVERVPSGSVWLHDPQALVHDSATDALTPGAVWADLRRRWPGGDDDRWQALVDALALRPHLDKTLAMLSTGSRRKALMAAGLASGAAIVCLDQPFAALDAPSTRALQRALREDADDGRVIVIADFEVPADLAVDSALTLPPP